MKKLLLLPAILGLSGLIYGQNINDNKVNVEYIQLPYIKIDNAFKKYDITVKHSYKAANADSTNAFEMQKKYALEYFELAMTDYQRRSDSLDRVHLRNMAAWQQSVNSGATQANGQALPQPQKPIYPVPPVYPRFDAPMLHSDLDENAVKNPIDIQGFQKGLGGFVVTIDVLPLQNVRIQKKKKGTGSTTKYTYTAQYQLPVEVAVEVPTQGKIMHLRIEDGVRTYTIGEYKTTYDFDLYMMDNKARFYQDLERHARTQAVQRTNNYLNDQIGFVKKNRRMEFYSVKKFKNYDYSDVTNAYTQSVQAIQLVKNNRDRSGAVAKIDAAIAAWKEIMFESNTFDGKARINSKITGMIQCNLAELYMWKADFDESEVNLNLAVNGGGKFKRHANNQRSFYADQKKRWKANF